MSAGLITGLPRHGKSLFGVMQAKAELVDGTRYLVTNLPFDVAKLGAYLDSIGCPVTPGMWDRLRILTAEETAEFWLYDPEGEINKAIPLVHIQDRPWRQSSLKKREDIMVPDFSHRQRKDYPGVLFLIDEAHLFFDAHQWQQLGSDMSFFVSQHGHMRTDILLITQHPAKLAKRLRLDLEEWTVVENLGRLKGWKGVTIPGWFRRTTYPGSPDSSTEGVEPDVGRFRLDQSLADCYSTSAGVGLAGRIDTQEKKRGKHWTSWLWYLGIGAAAACVIPLVGLKLFGAAIHAGLGTFFDKSTGAAIKIVSNAPALLPPPGPPAHPPFPAAVPEHPRTVETSSLPAVTGKFLDIGLSLDDGRTLLARDGWRWTPLIDGFYVPGLGRLKWATGRQPGFAPSASHSAFAPSPTSVHSTL